MDDALHWPPDRRAAVRVLLADDDPWIRASFGLLLRDAGYEVLEVADGVATMDALLLSPLPLVVVLDLIMPRLTGFDLLLRVAKDEVLRTRHAYVVCSAKAPSAERIGEHFVSLLAHLNITYIARPCDIDVLLDAVAAAAARLCPEEGSSRQTEAS
jgi:CheY-like chemotaxis protein